MIFHTVHYLGHKTKYSNKEKANKETKGQMTHEPNQNPNMMMLVGLYCLVPLFKNENKE